MHVRPHTHTHTLTHTKNHTHTHTHTQTHTHMDIQIYTDNHFAYTQRKIQTTNKDALTH